MQGAREGEKEPEFLLPLRQPELKLFVTVSSLSLCIPILDSDCNSAILIVIFPSPTRILLPLAHTKTEESI